MILKQHHFLTPERPKEEEYIFGAKAGAKFTAEKYFSDLSEWQSLYREEEPEPKWISFDEREPNKGQEVYIKEYFSDLYSFTFGYHIRPYYKQKQNTAWADKATYDTRLQRWKDHQVKFTNFKKHIYKSTITEFSKTIDDKTVTVCFWSDTGETVVSIINDQNEIIFEMSATEIHLEEFEMVLKNRNINL